jgi:hypothetical protein
MRQSWPALALVSAAILVVGLLAWRLLAGLPGRRMREPTPELAVCSIRPDLVAV